MTTPTRTTKKRLTVAPTTMTAPTTPMTHLAVTASHSCLMVITRMDVTLAALALGQTGNFDCQKTLTASAASSRLQ